MKTLLIAPTHDSAAALRRAYLHDPNTIACAFHSITGHRGDRVVLLPLPPTSSDIEQATRARIIDEQVRTKVAPGGELVIL